MKIVKYVVSILSVLLFILLIYKIGFSVIISNFLTLGWGFVVVFIIAIGWQVLSAYSMKLAFEKTDLQPSFKRLLLSHYASESINSTTPLANIGGEPLRIYLIQKRIPQVLSLASTIIFRTCHSIAGVATIFLGTVLAMIYLPLSSNIKYSIIIAAITLFILVSFLVYRECKGFSGLLLKFTNKFKVNLSIEKAKEIDEFVRNFYFNKKKKFLLSILLNIWGRLLGAFEIFIIVRLLGANIDFISAMIISSVFSMISAAFSFVPNQVGVQEGGQFLLFTLMGLSGPIGFSLAVIKRIRKLAENLIGLLFILREMRA